MSQKDDDVRVYLLHNQDIIMADRVNIHDDLLTLDMVAEVMTHRQTKDDMMFLLLAWQPIELLDSTLMTFSSEKNVICELLPTSELVAYYRSWKMHEIEKRKRFSKTIANQLNHIVLNTKREHRDLTAEGNVPDNSMLHNFYDNVNLKFDRETEWGDPTANN